MLTPFSGLSLIVHLIVIGFATVFGFLFKKKNDQKLKRAVKETQTRMVLKSVLSISIIVVISSLMILSFVIALKTGIREGASEPQILYVRDGLAKIGTVHEVDAGIGTNNLKSHDQ